MPQSACPIIERRVICIATNEQVALAAVASTYFQDENTYFAVFEFPGIIAPYSPISNPAADGFIARVVGYRVAHQINNAVAEIQPARILLLGLTEIQQQYLRALLPAEIISTANNVHELATMLPYPQNASGYVTCRSHQIIEGLLAAKFKRAVLQIDDRAEILSSRHLHQGHGVVVIENAGDVHDVAAVNYAFSIDADVVLVQAVDKKSIREYPRILEKWSADNSHHEYDEIRREITKRIKGLSLREYKFATFFTVGLPYGLVLKNLTPCTHVLKYVDCGLFVARVVSAARSPRSAGAALLFSPQKFQSEETQDVDRILAENNYYVKSLLGKNATLDQLDNCGAYYPFDIMHICSHGGETDGYFVVQEFTDREGKHHKLDYYEVIGVSPTDTEKVKLTRKLIFVALDGVKWMSDELKLVPRHVFEDMSRALRDEKHDRILRVRYKTPIALSCHIDCYDSIHQGHFPSLGALRSPFVFNNTCSSSHELAASFIDAGASAYVATLWPVGNDTATRAAITFYDELMRCGQVLPAFQTMLNGIQSGKYQNVYILWGLHISTVRKPIRRSKFKVLRALLETYFLWVKKIETTPDPLVRVNAIPIAKFLSAEILRTVPQEHVVQIAPDFNPAVLDSIERSLRRTETEEDSRIPEKTLILDE